MKTGFDVLVEEKQHRKKLILEWIQNVSGYWSYKELAREFGISLSTIKRYCRELRLVSNPAPFNPAPFKRYGSVRAAEMKFLFDEFPTLSQDKRAFCDVMGLKVYPLFKKSKTSSQMVKAGFIYSRYREIRKIYDGVIERGDKFVALTKERKQELREKVLKYTRIQDEKEGSSAEVQEERRVGLDFSLEAWGDIEVSYEQEGMKEEGLD